MNIAVKQMAALLTRLSACRPFVLDPCQLFQVMKSASWLMCYNLFSTLTQSLSEICNVVWLR